MGDYIFSKKDKNVRFPRNLTPEEMEQEINDVLNDDDFKRHLKETAKKLRYPYVLVESVMTQYVRDLFKEVTKRQVKKRRINISGFFILEILEPEHNEHSIYHKSNNKKEDVLAEIEANKKRPRINLNL